MVFELLDLRLLIVGQAEAGSVRSIGLAFFEDLDLFIRLGWPQSWCEFFFSQVLVFELLDLRLLVVGQAERVPDFFEGFELFVG